MGLNKFIQNLIREPMMRKFYCRILDNHVLDEGFSSQVFEPNKGYFQIRLSEMFLQDKREYWRGFVPSCIVISDFLYNGRRQTIPFYVGNQLLKQIEKYIKGQNVEYLNTRIAGPIPYVGDDISVFIGLFRTQVTDLAENLFDFLETIVSAFDAKILSTYLNIARPLSNGLNGLLGMKEVELRLGTQDVFSDKPNDPHQFREGYFAYINCPESNKALDNLWVNDGRLFIGKDKDSIQPLREDDYCLIKIEQLSERNDYIAFPFHRLWEDAKKEIFQGDEINAQRIFMQLTQQLAISPDLTQKHRYRLIQAYQANFQKEISLYEDLHGFVKERTATVSRGAMGGVLKPQEYIKKTAYLADQAGLSKEAVNGLLDISENWEGIPKLEDRPKDFELTDAILNEQLKTLETVSRVEQGDPKALADAIAVAALSPT